MRAMALALLVCLTLARPGSAYDVPTHSALGRRAADIASTLDSHLRDDLGMPDGRATLIRNGKTELLATDWIRLGAWEEDRPFWRVRHHFHNPLLPWIESGLRLDTNPTHLLGMSSILRGQQVFQEGPEGGGTWSWPFARRRLLTALTAATPSERDIALADALRALGQLTHFIQDATVPAHVRNDMHLWLPLGGDRFLPVNPDGYEDWVQEVLELSLDGKSSLFPDLLALPPKRPLRLVFHSEHPQAPIPIAGLIDTEQYAADGPLPPLLGPHAFGAAEVTNANFLSRDTVFTFAVRPTLADLGDPFVQARPDGTFRRYAPKLTRGTPTVEVSHFVAEGVLAHRLAALPAAPPASVMWILDELVHEHYARQLIPRAVGYSAELLDYFFRGRLAVELVPDPLDASVVRVIGANGSPEPLYEGTLTLHADRLNGERGPATPLEPLSVVGVAPGEPVISARFRLPEDSERVVAVFQGTLGLERRTEEFPGAVIGKVLGGVRVEEVFAEGDRWRLRTPRGVFELPLATAIYDEVKWGDGDHVLVARTSLDAELPFVDAFEIVRQPGSIEPVVAGSPPVVELRPLATASLAFASAPLVTTLTFEQTTAYRQQIARWGEVAATRWDDVSIYDVVSVTRAPLEFETIHNQDVTFAATIPVRLDTDHSIDLGSLDDPYYWELVDVGADRNGRLLGLAAITLTEPPVAPVDVPWFRLQNDGRPVATATVPLRARFPESLTIIWALVDLGAGEVIAATAERAVRVVAQHAAEGPPWDSAGASNVQFPGIYREAVTTFAGGPLSGQVARSFEAHSLAPRTSTTGISARLDARGFEQAVTVSGWFQPEIKAALAASGLSSFDAGETASSTARWNYACVANECVSEDDYLAFEVRFSRGGLLNPPAELLDARRARPAPAGERLVLLGDAFRTTFRPVGSVVTWDAERRTAREALAIPDSFHGLGEDASTGAVLVSYSPRTGTAGTFLVPLDDGAVASFFAGRNLLFDFRVLGRGQLYSVRDFRFYRGEPPLQATPLPARLSPLSPNPVGDYHAIRLP